MVGVDRTDELATLISRFELLDLLCQSPLHMRDIVDETGKARTTVHRAVTELTELGLVRRCDDGIEATLTGRFARNLLTESLDGLDDIFAAQAVLDPLPANTDIEYEALKDSEAILAANPTPYRPSNRISEAIVGATGYRALLPTLDDPRTVRVLYEHVVTRGNSVELVVSREVFRTLQEEFPRRMAILAESKQFTVLVGEIPLYGLALLSHEAETSERTETTAHLVVHNDNGGVHGVIVTENQRGLSWAMAQYEQYRREATDRTAELIANNDGGVQTDVSEGWPLTGWSLPVSLEREGFVRVDASFFQDQRVASPQTAWRTGLSLAEVHTGYAIERNVDAEETGESGDGALAMELTTALTAGSNCVLVGQPGSGKSTVCKQVACGWYDSDRGHILYRDGVRGQAFRSVDDLVSTASDADGHTLVVVEDAVHPDAEAVFDAIEQLDDDEVSVLLDAREHEWSTYSQQSVIQPDIDVVHLPPMQPEDCDRLVDNFERTIGKPVNVSSAQLWETVREKTTEDAPHELLRLTHRLATYADPIADSPTTLENAVSTVYDEVADDETTLLVALLANILNVTGVGVDKRLLYAVAEDDGFEAIDSSLKRLEGNLLFAEEHEHYRTVHEEWSVTFLLQYLEAVGAEAASAQFGAVVTELLALADEPERCDQIGKHLGTSPPITNPAVWADGTTEAVFDRGTQQSKLAPLFGDGDDETIELPRACSETVVESVPVWLGQIFLAGGYYDRAERAFGPDPPGTGEHAVERLLGLARLHTERSEHEQAVAYCKECLAVLDAEDLPAEFATIARARARLQHGETLAKYNQYADAEAQFQSALEALEVVEHPGLRAKALSNIGNMAVKQGEYERAQEHYDTSLSLVREWGDRRTEADILNSAATVPWVQGENDEARRLFEQALDLREQLGDRHGEAKTLYNIGLTIKQQAQYDLAQEYFERSLDGLRAVGDSHTEVQVLGALGLSLMKQGEYDRAQRLFEQWLDHSRALGDSHDEARALNNLGLLARRQGEYERATSIFEQSLELKEELGDSQGVARTLTNLGQVAVLQGQFDRASGLLEDSLARKERFDGTAGVASTINSFGTLNERRSKLGKATKYFTRGLETAREANESSQIALAYQGLAEVAVRRGDYETASEHIERAAEATTGEKRTLATELRLSRARLAHAKGEFEDARSHAETALQEFDERNEKYGSGQSKQLLGRIAASAGDEEVAREKLLEALEIFEASRAYHDVAEALEQLAGISGDSGDTREQYHERARISFSTAPEEVRERYSRWVGGRE